LTISGGHEKSAGGILNQGTLTLSNSTVSGNLSRLETIPDCCSYGGGIYNGGTLIISNSTVSGNSADNGGGGISNNGTLTISNSTLSGNSGGEGGAIANYKTLTVSNSTVSGNSSIIGGGIFSDTTIHPNLSLNLNTSIVANNTGRDGPDVQGTVSSGDYNLIENTDDTILPAGSTHNITGVDPTLGPLADNGGPTMTHALLCGSPAIDQGKNPIGLTTDQRGAGFARKFDDPAMGNAADGDGTDIGAFELQEPPVCNTAPVANGDSYSTNEDTPLSGSTVLVNDSDSENDTLTASLVGGPTNAQSFTLNADGSFSYTPNENFNGSDSFTYKANDGSLDSNVATVTITVNAVNDGPVVSATPSSQSVQYSDPISVVTINGTDIDSTRLTAGTTFNVGGGAFSDGLPSGLSFGLAVCSGKVGSQCRWGLSGKANVAAGTYVIRVTVSDGVLSSYSDVTLVVTKEKAETVYTGDVFMFTAGPTVTTANVRLSAQLTQQADGNAGDITKAKVSFLLFKSTNLGSTPDLTVGGVPVDAAGAALKFVNLGVDTWTIKVKIDADNEYWKASPVGMGTITVEQPTNELRTSGGGWVADAQSLNGKGNFGFNVANQKKGVRGGSVYLFRGLDGFNYLVKSTSWQSGGVGFGAEGAILSKAAFSGKCVVQKIDADTGEIVESYGNYSFTVDVRDGDLFNPKQADKYAVTVLNSSGLVWRQIGSSTNPPAIGGGNITVKAK
jgi:VCBS repeat-containing protein